MKKTWTTIYVEELCVMNTQGGKEGMSSELDHINSKYALNHPEWFTDAGWTMSIGADNGKTPLTNPYPNGIFS